MTMPQPVLDTTKDRRRLPLARLKSELESALRYHEERLLEVPEPDDIAYAIYRRSENAHEEITAALSRISEGTYGTCKTCDRPISRDRLEAMPHTRLCMACAQGAGR